jgi:hypothetical protein
MPIYHKKDFSLDQIRRFLDPSPIVLVSSVSKRKTNIMTMGLVTDCPILLQIAAFFPCRLNGAEDVPHVCDLTRRWSETPRDGNHDKTIEISARQIKKQIRTNIMSKFIHSVLIAAALLTSTSAVMAAPRRVPHTPHHYYDNSSERAWQWWDNEADHR